MFLNTALTSAGTLLSSCRVRETTALYVMLRKIYTHGLSYKFYNNLAYLLLYNALESRVIQLWQSMYKFHCNHLKSHCNHVKSTAVTLIH